MVRCPKCGAENDADAVFCSKCGASLYPPSPRRTEKRGDTCFGGEKVEDECFGIPNGGAIVGIIFGGLIIILGLAAVTGVDVGRFIGPGIMIIIGLLIIVGVVFSLGRRRR